MEVNARHWIEHLVGYSEAELLERMKAGKVVSFLSKQVQDGEFTLYSIGQLLSEGMGNVVKVRDKWPRFTLYIRDESKQERDHSYFDTSSLQRLLGRGQESPPMFQVASNFNAQENGRVWTDLFDGNYLTDLMTDSTQGPSAAAGCGAGAIKRWVRHYHDPINLLEKVKVKCNVENGKLQSIEKGVMVEDILLGLQAGVSANFDRSKVSNTCIFYDDSVLVDQVFTSTMALEHRYGIQDKIKVEHLVLLKAAYDGTYLLAKKRHSPKLVLTLVGGGVFNNPHAYIFDSMIAAHLAFARQCLHLEQVILPLYDSKVEYQLLVKGLLKAGVPKSSITIEYK